MQHGIIARRNNNVFGYFGWGSVIRLNDRTLVAACSGERTEHVCPFGKTELFYSYDEGLTWSCPVVVNNTVLDDRDVGLLRTGDNTLLLTWFNHPLRYCDYPDLPQAVKALRQAYMDMAEPFDEKKQGAHIRISRDGGFSWGEEKKVEMSSPHGPCMLADGSILFLGKTMYSDIKRRGEADYQDLAETVGAWRSTDGGESWEKLCDLQLPEHTEWKDFHEPYAVQLPSGRIIGMLRAHVDPAYFRHPGTMFQTYSDDGGKTWSVPEYMDISGFPPHLMLHSSGALVCVYGRRTEPFGERAIISYDEGKSWSEEIELIRGRQPDLGYPCSVERKDGSILTAYYQRYEENGEEDARTSFLYTIWTLPDVK